MHLLLAALTLIGEVSNSRKIFDIAVLFTSKTTKSGLLLVVEALRWTKLRNCRTISLGHVAVRCFTNHLGSHSPLQAQSPALARIITRVHRSIFRMQGSYLCR